MREISRFGRTLELIFEALAHISPLSSRPARRVSLPDCSKARSPRYRRSGVVHPLFAEDHPYVNIASLSRSFDVDEMENPSDLN